jgi:hypothetical protein
MTTRPFLGTVATFREAYPEVKTLRLVGEQRGELARERQAQVYYTHVDIPENIPCANPRCRQGGFSLRTILMTLTGSREESYEGEFSCNGHEGTPKGRRKGDPCGNSLKFTLTLTYK